MLHLASKCLSDDMKVQTVFLSWSCKGISVLRNFWWYMSVIQVLIERSVSRKWRPRSDAAEHPHTRHLG